MRVMLATDGSAAAGVATELVASTSWPSDTSVEVVTSVDGPATRTSLFAPSGLALGPLEDALRAQHTAAAEATAAVAPASRARLGVASRLPPSTTRTSTPSAAALAIAASIWPSSSSAGITTESFTAGG